jgi:GTP-binding protein
VSKPEVIYHYEDGRKQEPIERMVADVPQAYAGAVIEKIGRRRGTLESMGGSDRCVWNSWCPAGACSAIAANL